MLSLRVVMLPKPSVILLNEYLKNDDSAVKNVMLTQFQGWVNNKTLKIVINCMFNNKITKTESESGEGF